MADDRLMIFDTTLRDGEQSPGASMNLAEKLEVAHALRDLGVDVIEAGFPIASPGDFEAVQAIARQVEGPIICGLARCNAADIDRAWEALKESPQPRIHVFLATSAIHREFKLKMAKEEILRRAVEGVQRAKDYCDDVEFSPEDAARTELDFLAEVVERAIEAGATTVNIPDTVGYAVPSQYAAAIAHLKKHVRSIDKVDHQRSLPQRSGPGGGQQPGGGAGGARQVECTINGIGERAGNAPLEEIVMAVQTRGDFFGLTTGINTKRLYHTSRLVSHVTGIQVQRNKAIVGQNAFAHEAGIHQDGMLKERSTYEIMNPEDVGSAADGAGAGQAQRPARPAAARRRPGLPPRRGAAAEGLRRLQGAGRPQEERSTTPTSRRWRKRRFTRGPADVDAGGGHLQRRLGDDPVGGGVPVAPGRHASTARPASATARWTRCSRRSSASPASRWRCSDYRVRSVTVGEDAQGEAHIEADYNGRNITGRAVSTDIIEASALAFLQVINRIVSRKAAGEPIRPTQNPPKELVASGR